MKQKILYLFALLCSVVQDDSGTNTFTYEEY